jgi:hypothetical protein
MLSIYLVWVFGIGGGLRGSLQDGASARLTVTERKLDGQKEVEASFRGFKHYFFDSCHIG